jgi:hypothetical protein
MRGWRQIRRTERIHMEGDELCRSVSVEVLTVTAGALNNNIERRLYDCINKK